MASVTNTYLPYCIKDLRISAKVERERESIIQFESPWASCSVESRDKLRTHDASWVNGCFL